jgi:hypothetical protein
VQAVPEEMEVSSADSLIQFLTQELGGVVTAISPAPTAPMPRKRRRRLDLSAAPQGPVVKKPLFGGSIPEPPLVAQEAVQLALF